jgi:hypothetical protein
MNSFLEAEQSACENPIQDKTLMGILRFNSNSRKTARSGL